MGMVYRRQRIEGVTIPAIIHNRNYFLVDMAVYEDGIIGCWHKSDLQQFKEDLKKGWVVPSIPNGQTLSVHALGDFQILDAHWKYDAQRFYYYVEEVVRSLNPEMVNLYHTTQREIKKWEKARVAWSAVPTPCKLKNTFGYNLLKGRNSYIFCRQNGILYLTTLTSYEDRTIQIKSLGDQFFTMEEVNLFFADKTLCTFPEDKEWVMIQGLGEILLTSDSYSQIPSKEKQKEIAETLTNLSGEKDAHARCIDAYYEYLINPCEWNRENLRKAYESVPEHERMYLGDMDNRDSDFIRILYEPERKREV